MIVGIDDNDD